MKRLSFNPRFVNEAGNDLIPGKIHTIRRNYAYWKRFEGQDIALFTWTGKPYRSKQKVFCVKRLVSVQEVIKSEVADFWLSLDDKYPIPINVIAKHDGFKNKRDFIDWFIEYPFGDMAVLHFTDYRY
jgi:hypothetical protein